MKLKASQIKPNPNNPRIIKDEAFKKLVKSIEELPEMADVRPIVVNQDYVILGGNMRFKAMQAAGWKEIPVHVVDWTEDKQREFIIKDNVSGGEWDWDILANEWDIERLDEWGVTVPALASDYGEDFSLKDGDKDPFGQMTFMLADMQIEVIKEALAVVGNNAGDTYGNENGNGNKLYWICEQWLAQKK